MCENSLKQVPARTISEALLILPKGLESIGCQLGISHRVFNIPTAEIMLDRAGIVPLVGEF